MSYRVECDKCKAQSSELNNTEECVKHGWMIRTIKKGAQSITDFLCPLHIEGNLGEK